MSNVEIFFLIVDFLAIGIIIPVVLFFNKLIKNQEDIKDVLVEIKESLVKSQERCEAEHKEMIQELQESRRENSNDHRDFVASLEVLKDRSKS